ncbi:hypothetical protein Q1695_012694 [Nippostrongylus brasiliensis]|nr:hypothetical protein Q1695_012694 [Nippostrongylus brasiliensis]
MLTKLTLLIVLAAVSSLHAKDAVQAFSLKDKCDACKSLMLDVNAKLPTFTRTTEELLKQVLKATCERYLHFKILAEICVVFEERVIHDLFVWITDQESRLIPDRECQYLRMCPRTNFYAAIAKLAKDYPVLPKLPEA